MRNAYKAFKVSIVLQVFLSLLFIFLLVLVIQTLIFANYFNQFYKFSMLNDIRSEFKRITDEFSDGGEEQVNEALREYTIKHQAPILVFNKDYLIMDRYFFDQLSMLTLCDSNNVMYKIPLQRINKLTNISVYEKLNVEAVRLGSSTYYEPTLIRSEKQTYLIRQPSTYNNYDSANLMIFNSVQSKYYQQGGGRMENRAWYIYDLVKDCLINRTDIDAHLAKIAQFPFTDNTGTVYYVISQTRQINEQTLYFVTIRQIILTGTEGRYFNKFFYFIFIFLCFALTVTAYILSRRFSAPIRKLSSVTEKLAHQDFSVRTIINSRNEIGQLSSNINLLADNLESAMDEFRKSADNACQNEMKMKMLLADLAHEFKTPLGIISLYVEVIEKQKFEKKPQYYFNIIEHEIENLTQMIDDTIQLTKMQAGYLEYNPGSVELNDLINIALSRFSEKLAEENFTLNVQSLDLIVIADGRRIEQVLTNLISNAIKYSTEIKRIEVEVTQQGQLVTVGISNYGHVSDKDLNRIWERYYSAEKDSTTRLPSQGIGLEIVRGILQMHNSHFGVKQEGGRICFYFTLNLAYDN